MSTTSCSKSPDFDAIKPHLRELGTLLFAWANAQDRRLPSMEAGSYRGTCPSCPACGDWQIEGGSVSIEDGLALQPVSCLTCHATWRDVDVLSGFDQLIIEHSSADDATPDGPDKADP
jgi:hypothetical protein